MAADGKQDGKEDGQPCDVNKTCDATLGLFCQQDTGLCKFISDGKHDSLCRTDLDCSKALSGLRCDFTQEGENIGICDCSEKSDVLSKCDVDRICTAKISWPAAFRDPSPKELGAFTGGCSEKPYSWYKLANGNCKVNEMACLQRDNESSVTCIAADQWTGQGAGASCAALCWQIP